MGLYNIPEKLIDFRVYGADGALMGVADVELPEISYLTDTVKGAGIAGEVNSPTIGQFESMETKLTWLTVSSPMLDLGGASKGRLLDVRGAQQIRNTGTGELITQAVKVLVGGTTKKTSLGKFEKAATTGSTTTLETTYLKIIVDGKTVLEIDKYNYIANVGGEVDELGAVRSALGMD